MWCTHGQQVFVTFSGGNFDNFIGQHVNGRNSAAEKFTNTLLLKQIFKIPSTTRNQTYSPCVMPFLKEDF